MTDKFDGQTREEYSGHILQAANINDILRLLNEHPEEEKCLVFFRLCQHLMEMIKTTKLEVVMAADGEMRLIANGQVMARVGDADVGGHA